MKVEMTRKNNFSLSNISVIGVYQYARDTENLPLKYIYLCEKYVYFPK